MEIINQILSILGTALVAILAIVIPALAKLVGEYISTLIEKKKAEIGVHEYEANKKLAIDLAKVIEERFRLGELVGDKAEEFTKLIVEKIPYVTKAQIDELRNLAVKSIDESIGKHLE